jgi:hypothetical protein
VQQSRGELSALTELESLLIQLRAARRLALEVRQLAANRDFGSAILLYRKAEPLLQRYGHHGFLRGVCKEVAAAVQA